MSIDVTILRARGLVYIRYSGFAWLDDTIAALDAYGNHPDFRPGHKQLVDMARVTGIERDYVKFMKLQAKKAEVFLFRRGADAAGLLCAQPDGDRDGGTHGPLVGAVGCRHPDDPARRGGGAAHPRPARRVVRGALAGRALTRSENRPA